MQVVRVAPGGPAMLTPAEVPLLDGADCQVWWARPGWLRPAHQRLLDRVEQGRRVTYRSAADRDRFTLGVVVTRTVLGAQLDVAPDRVPIDRACSHCRRKDGRPRLKGRADLHFSVSHSAGLVVVAVASGCPVGVDVERISTLREPAVAELVLSPAERAAYDALAPDARGPAFFRYWTRKEAVLKATGDGLRMPMSGLTLSAPDEPPRLLDWAGREELSTRISLVDLRCDSSAYSATLAVIDGAPAVHQFSAFEVIGGRRTQRTR